MRYDPILCMLVDEPTKAQDELKIKKEDGLWCVYKDGKVIGQSNSEAGALRLYRMFESKAHDAMPSDLKKAGYEVGTVEKYGSTYYTLVYNGKVISTSPTEANIVEKAKKHYANRHGKAQDAKYRVYYGMSHNQKSVIVEASSESEAAEKYAKSTKYPGTVHRVEKIQDSASALDKAIKTCDAVDVDRISNYLWLWVEGREVVSMLFSEGLDKYSGPRDKEHKDEAYDFAKKYAKKELDALYSKLKSSVEKKLKEGYTNIKNAISSAK